jgi:hypothetical protein
LRRIKPHAPPLVRAPVNFFEFQPCGRTPQAEYLMVSLRHRMVSHPTPNTHRLGRGLPGYLILFAPHAFAPQRQFVPRWPPSPQTFLLISTHFTATPGIPPSSEQLKYISFAGHPRVEPWTSTMRLNIPPTRPLSPVNPNNARHLRLTAAAGTELAVAYSYGTVTPIARDFFPY